MASSISADEASVTDPMTSSVAGLMLSKVLPESASTSFPSMSIRCSGLTFTASATFLFLSSLGFAHPTKGTAVPLVTGKAPVTRLGRRFWRVSDFDVAVKIGDMLVRTPR